VPDDRRAFPRDPDLRLARLVVRVTAMLPVPTQAQGVGGIGAVRAAIQRIDAAPVVGAETIDLGHEILFYDGRFHGAARTFRSVIL